MAKRIHRKATAKRPARKLTRRRRKADQIVFDPSTVLDMDQVYRAINKVQLTREKVTFIARTSESVVLDNILKDLTLEFEKNTKVSGCPDCVEYTILPPPEPVEREEEEFDDSEEFPDEIAEDGQIFFD